MDTVPLSNSATPPTEPAIAHPPRYWWLKRGAAVVLIAIVALVGLRLWWGHAAARGLKEMVDAAHARGEPILPEDFDPPSVPPGNNAALSLSKAAASMVMNNQFTTLHDANLDNPTPAQIQTMGAVIGANRAALQLARRARSQTQVSWGFRPRTPVMFTYPPPGPLTGQRNLATLLGWAALHDHATGDDREAIECIRDILRQAEALDHAAPTVVPHLVVIGIINIATEHVQQIAWDLSVGGGSSSAKSPATPKQVRDLITELLNEEPFRQGAVLSWDGERMMLLDTVHQLSVGVADPLRKLWLVKPMFDLDGLRIARHCERAARATTQPNWPAAKMKVGSESGDDNSNLGQLTHELSTMLAPALDRSILQQFRALTERRVAAIELAIRLYRVDHGGKYPAALAELMPRYLPAVPFDPMAAGSKSMSYRPDAKPPVIYSVGEDGKDDGGTSLPNDGPKGYRWLQPDAVYPLEPLPPATQPSSETENNQ